MYTQNNTRATKVNDNLKANLIAFGIMAVILIAGILYGMELESIGY